LCYNSFISENPPLLKAGNVPVIVSQSQLQALPTPASAGRRQNHVDLKTVLFFFTHLLLPEVYLLASIGRPG
jgi:hypothetical protein